MRAVCSYVFTCNISCCYSNVKASFLPLPFLNEKKVVLEISFDISEVIGTVVWLCLLSWLYINEVQNKQTLLALVVMLKPRNSQSSTQSIES